MKKIQFTLFAANCCGNAANTLYPTKFTITNVEEFKAATRNDHTQPFFKGFTRGNENFVAADCVAMDVDNDHSDNPAEWLRAQGMQDYFSDVAYVAAPSRHDMQAKGGKSARPRFHMYFPIKEVMSAEVYKALKAKILRRFPFFDANAVDVARFFFGNAASEVIWHEGERGIDEVIDDNSEFGIRNSELNNKANADRSVSLASGGSGVNARATTSGSTQKNAEFGMRNSELNNKANANVSARCESGGSGVNARATTSGSAQNGASAMATTSGSTQNSVSAAEPGASSANAEGGQVIRKGTRNNSMYRFAVCAVKRFGITSEAYDSFIAESGKCVPPLDTKELSAIWASACKFYNEKIVTQPGYLTPAQYAEKWAAEVNSELGIRNSELDNKADADGKASLATPAKNASVNFNSNSQSNSCSNFNSNSQSKFQSRFNSEFRIPNSELNSPSLAPDDFSDLGQAYALARNYADNLKYAEATDWLVYDGRLWTESRPLALGRMEKFLDAQLADAEDRIKAALAACKDAGIDPEAAKEGGKKFQAALSRAQRNALADYRKAQGYKAFAMQRRDMKYVTAAMLAAQPLLYIEPEALDADGFLLNTPAGTFDLREGMSGKRPHRAEDFCTKMTAYAPGEEGSQAWEEALKLFFQQDAELIDYVQKIAGLCAIGTVFREEMIIAFGEGSNGKSTFFNAIAGALGTYSGTISADALTINCRRNVKPELAEAKGKRLLIAAELEEGMRLSTSIVKQVCSTDPITGEKKYKSPFKFKPSHTLILYTNHLPRVGALDAGTWRRLIVIPFKARIEGSGDKKNYAEELLRTSGAYILRWIIEGAQKVIAADFHIAKPRAVEEAIGKFKADNDWLAHFLDECCQLGAGLEAKSGAVYEAYREFCAKSGEYARSTTDFYNALAARGIEKEKRRNRKIFVGLKLISEASYQ